MDAICEFSRAFPFWLNSEGLPKSWRVFRWGWSYLSRAHAKEMLHRAEAVRAGGAEEKGWKEWQERQLRKSKS